MSAMPHDERWPGLRACAWMLGVGLLVRYVLAPYTSYPHDVEPWQGVAVASMHHLDLYQRPGFSYPPLWGFLLRGVGSTLSALGVHPSALGHDDAVYSTLGVQTQSYASIITSPLFNLAFKSVLFAFDLATAVLVYRIVRSLTGSSRRAAIGFAAWFLNPFVIYESAVHGAFDGIVAFFVIGAVALLLAGRLVWSGAAIAAGTMTKLAPLILLPLFVLLAIRSPGRAGTRTQSWRGPTFVLAGFAAATAVTLLPLVVTGDLSRLSHSVFSRGDTSVVVGGFSFWGVRHFALFSGIFDWAVAHSTLATRISSVAELIAVLAVTVIAGIFVARRDWRQALLGGSCSVMIVALLVAPLTQPQYLEWVLPLIVVMVVVGLCRWWQLAAMSVGPLVLGIGFLGPAALLATLSEWTRAVAPGDVASSVLTWYRKPAVALGSSFKDDFAAVAVLITLPSMLAVSASLRRRRAVGAASTALDARDDASPVATSDERGIARTRDPGGTDRSGVPHAIGRMALVLAVLSLSVAAIAEVGAYAPMLTADTTRLTVTSVDRVGNSSDLHATVAVARDEEGLRILAVPVARRPVDRRVTVYLDPVYPMSGSDLRTTQGIYDHLSAELDIRRYPEPVSTTDAAGLAALLSNVNAAPFNAIVVTTGVFPFNVFSRSVDLVTPWVRAGGLLVWGGAPIGYYSGHPGLALDPSDAGTNLRDLGPSLLLGPQTTVLHYVPGREAPVSTTIATALGLEYRGTSAGIRSADVGSRGATLLGWADGSFSSITYFPTGKGGLLVFGGDVFDEVILAHDLTLTLMSHVLDASSALAYQDVYRPSTTQSPVTMHIPGLIDGAVFVTAFDPSEQGVFLTSSYREVVPQ